MDVVTMNAALCSLFNACYVSGNPRVTLFEELSRLRATGQWPEVELGRLQQLAIKTITAITGRR
jgi:hypothetical protein